jgi:hypothetical protein
MGFRTLNEIYKEICRISMDLLAEVRALNEEAKERVENNSKLHEWWQSEKKRADAAEAELEKLKNPLKVVEQKAEASE